ncbi:MAG: hypothetical protein U1C49_02465 [Candidatus Andersenbacteria bacterium]|nr:hypothetical protein [bacterium]MDZ4225691.1 hypothetical protein [Candidatus Andersenbacteria bacterium]
MNRLIKKSGVVLVVKVLLFVFVAVLFVGYCLVNWKNYMMENH